MTKHARLRTKTGCFTCRKRRVKCGEERPCCRNCSSSSRQCNWPASDDLYDRRHFTRAPSKSSSPRSPSRSGALVPATPRPRHEDDWVRLSPNWRLDGTGIECDADFELFHHFINSFIHVLVLPTWERAGLLEYESRLVSLMTESQGTRCAVLAASAANKHMLTNDKSYEKLALVYYSRAVWHANKQVQKLMLPHQVPTDALLTTVVYLYIHDTWGLDPTVDPRRHVAGAIKLLNMRHGCATQRPTLRSTFDRFTAESVLYHGFLLSVRRPLAPDFCPDPQFLVPIQRMLAPETRKQSSSSAMSPILGATHLLYRLILDIIHLHTTPEAQGPDRALQLKREMSKWEAKIPDPQEDDAPAAQADFYMRTLSLYVLAASLLLDWTIDFPGSNVATDPGDFFQRPASSGENVSSCMDTKYRWQTALALSILRQPGSCETWSRCYLGTWPMLIFGHAVSTEEDIMLIRHVLEYTRHRMGYGENQRILNELESVWNSRAGTQGVPVNSATGP